LRRWKASGTEKGAGLRLFGWPDEEAEVTRYSIEIPKAASLILTHSLDGEIKGLKEWYKEDRPPVAIVFWSFRVMVGIGMLMLLTGMVGAFLFWRKKLFEARWFHAWSAAMMPSGFIAVLAGWFVTEVGRQPFTVYGVIRTDESNSPVLPEYIAISLMIFIVSYIFIFGMGSYYILKLIRKGPQKVADAPDSKETYGSHGVEEPAIVGDDDASQGGQ